MFRVFVINTDTRDEQGIPGSHATASEARSFALTLLSPFDAASRVSGVKFSIEIRRNTDGRIWQTFETCIH